MRTEGRILRNGKQSLEQSCLRGRRRRRAPNLKTARYGAEEGASLQRMRRWCERAGLLAMGLPEGTVGGSLIWRHLDATPRGQSTDQQAM